MELKALFAQCTQRKLIYFEGQSHAGCFTISFSEGRNGRGSSISITQWQGTSLVEAEIHIQCDNGTRLPEQKLNDSDFDVVVRETLRAYDALIAHQAT